MPRRNRRAKMRPHRSQTPLEKPAPTCDQLARGLVRRGLASPAIISGPYFLGVDRKDDDDA